MYYRNNIANLCKSIRVPSQNDDFEIFVSNQLILTDFKIADIAWSA